ncbi:MAG TPA: GNAT family N-acetyltransferase, partial [Gemmataceae bacterium]|nr:GNAT family N-acetyltransferase [Gemmataceae bacterium]
AACAVAVSPPRLAYSVFCSGPQAREFLDTYQEAERLAQAGRPTALLDVQLPLPFVITAAGYVEKYGPDERYNYLRFLPAVACPTLLTFGSAEVGSNMAFRGAPEAAQEIAARRPHLRVEIVPGADHFYSAARPDLLARVEAWLRATLPPPAPTAPGPARLRPATAADLPAIVAMRDRLNRLELAGCPHASIIPLSLEQFTALWGRTLDDPDSCWRIVEADGRPVGFGLIYLARPRTQPPTAFLHWAYLEEPQRRQGLGRRLVGELIAWAAGKGADRVELQFIEGNEPARQFWERMGFRAYARKAVRFLAGQSG